MEVKCNYCGSMISDRSEKCPHCGATNDNYHRSVDNTPTTIAELEQWYKRMNLPPYEKTRFFIGIDYKKPRAFGIYKASNGDFVVYKNKDNGQRAIRYQGKDEAYAVNELYLKLKAEILNQKANNAGRTASGRGRTKMSKDDWIGLGTVAGFITVIGGGAVLNALYNGFAPAIIIALIVSFVLSIVAACTNKFPKIYDQNSLKRPILVFTLITVILFSILIVPLHKYATPKYYTYNDQIYCKYHHSWYVYDEDYDDYSEAYDISGYPDAKEVDRDSLYSTVDDWNYSSFTEFKDSYKYDETYSSDSDSSSSDSDYSWSSSDSWDSGSTDFSSDW